MKVARRIFCTDTPRVRQHFLTDDLLNAIPPGKCLALGTVWSGSLKPLLDATLEAMAPLTTGLTSGRVLHAEPSSASLDLGRTYLGQLRNKVLDAVRTFRGDEDEGIDLRPVAAGIRDLSEALMSGETNSMSWALDGLRRARDVLDAATSRRTGDGGEWLVASDASSRQRVAAMNDANTAFWKDRLPTARSGDATYRAPQGASAQTTEVRNQVAAANQATSMPAKIESLNRAHAAFWADRI